MELLEHNTAGDLAGPQPERRYLLERVGDAAVVQLYADGFRRLPADIKILSYHLCLAALAGRDIFYDQKYEHALILRSWLEELYLVKDRLDGRFAAELERYLKLFWIHNGPHHHESGRKETLFVTFDEFNNAVNAAVKAGAKFPSHEAKTFEETLQFIYHEALNPERGAISINKSPGPGKDMLRESASNFYKNVSLADLEGFAEKYPLNSRIVKNVDGTIVEEVWRCGDGASIPPGRYAKEISNIVAHLTDALPFAPPPTRRALECLIQYYKTGEAEDFRKYNIAWVADRGVVDTVNGFIEVYCDPRGQKGAFEGIVSYVNFDKTDEIRRLAERAAWFEERMPWDDVYKKKEVVGIIANAIDVILETGDSGPVTPIGINLPNPQDIREHYGSKSVNLSNVGEAYERATPISLRKEFCYNKEEFERAARWSSFVSDVHTNMHEVIGHASGRLRGAAAQGPAKALREYYSTIEEARADLVALWFIGDPDAVDAALSPGYEAALAEYESYTRNALLAQLRRVKHGDRLEEDHARNRMLIVKWILKNSTAIEERLENGKHYYIVTDREGWRRAAGELLRKVMAIKGEGDYDAAKALVEEYGIYFDTNLRDEVLERVKLLNPPSYTGFVQPRLAPVRDERGNIVDIQISYPCDLARQMLEWSGRPPASEL